MKRKINFIFLTIVLIISFMIAEIIIIKSISNYEPTVNIIYAKQFIPAKTEIKAEMLAEKKVSLSMSNKKSVKSINEVIGKKTKVDIEEGEMLLDSKLGNSNEMQDIRVTDKNNRLFTLELKADQANGWWIKVDQKVDIIYIPNPNVKQSMGLENLNRLYNIRVAALIDDNGRLLDNVNRSSTPKYVCLEVSQTQDEFLAYCKSNGRLELSVIPE